MSLALTAGANESVTTLPRTDTSSIPRLTPPTFTVNAVDAGSEDASSASFQVNRSVALSTVAADSVGAVVSVAVGVAVVSAAAPSPLSL